MLNTYKYFKFSKKAGFNLFNNPKFAFLGYRFHKSKRWEGFSKPIKTQSTVFWISRYYYLSRLTQTKNFLFFFKRKKKKLINVICFSLDFCLHSVRFFKTIRDARRAVFLGFVSVNGHIVRKADYTLREGDVVKLLNILSHNLFKQWRSSYFYSLFKDVKVFSQVGSPFEVSYSTGCFCLCYFNLFVGQLAQWKSVSFTQKMLAVQIRYCLNCLLHYNG